MKLPESFAEYTSNLFGEELWQRFLDSFQEETPVSIRLNSGTSLEALSHLPIAERIEWSERGYYLSERPQFTLDPLLHAGAYYVQEASSQFLDEVMRELGSRGSRGSRGLPGSQNAQKTFWLDMCAAPGGKSLILKDYLPAGGTLIANEYVRKRAWILAENIAKSSQECSPDIRVANNNTESSSPDIRVTNNAPEEIAAAGLEFQLILCDVPCSGEGMFRKDRATIDEWSPENVRRCAALQRSIVEQAWNCLSPGGVLIYSTCTFNEQEDEQNALYIQQTLGGQPIVPARKFIPGRDRGEGQFMAAFRKPSATPSSAIEPSATRPSAIEPSVPDGYVVGSSSKPDKKPDKKAEKKAEKRLQKALARLNFLELPQNHKGAPETPECELPLGQALNYLRGQSLILPAGTPRGLIAVTYKGLRLGLVKNIGSRANNLYPAEWRIKHL